MEIDFTEEDGVRKECEDCGIMFTPVKSFHRKCSECVKVPYQVDDAGDEDSIFGADFHEVKV